MNASLESSSAPGAPPLTLLGLEPLRAAFEYAGMRLMDASDFPRGDRHAVVVFPGLASDRHATASLTSFCEKLGYEAHDWGRGFNIGPRGELNAWLDELAAHVSSIAPHRAGDLSLVG